MSDDLLDFVQKVPADVGVCGSGALPAYPLHRAELTAERKSSAIEFLYYFIQANLINYMEFKYTFFAFVPLYVIGSICLQSEVDKINAVEGL